VSHLQLIDLFILQKQKKTLLVLQGVIKVLKQNVLMSILSNK